MTSSGNGDDNSMSTEEGEGWIEKLNSLYEGSNTFWALSEAAQILEKTRSADDPEVKALKAAEVLAGHLLLAASDVADVRAKAALIPLQEKSLRVAGQVGLELPATMFPPMIAKAWHSASSHGHSKVGEEGIRTEDEGKVHKLAAEEVAAFNAGMIDAIGANISRVALDAMCDNMTKVVKESPLLNSRLSNGKTMGESGYLEAALEAIDDIRLNGVGSDFFTNLAIYANDIDKDFGTKFDGYARALEVTANKVAQGLQHGTLDLVEKMTVKLAEVEKARGGK